VIRFQSTVQRRLQRSRDCGELVTNNLFLSHSLLRPLSTSLSNNTSTICIHTDRSERGSSIADPPCKPQGINPPAQGISHASRVAKRSHHLHRTTKSTRRLKLNSTAMLYYAWSPNDGMHDSQPALYRDCLRYCHELYPATPKSDLPSRWTIWRLIARSEPCRTRVQQRLHLRFPTRPILLDLASLVPFA
jgi:hypothetical protein